MLSRALRNTVSARPTVLGKAKKKEGGGFAPANPQLINIFKGGHDPIYYPIEYYPDFIREMLCDQENASSLVMRMLDGEELTPRAQWRLMRYMRRYKNQVIHGIKKDTFMELSNADLGVGAEEAEEERKPGQVRTKEEKKVEDDKRKQENEERIEAAEEARLEKEEIKKKGVMIKGKRVHMFTQKERKQMRKAKRLAEKARLSGKLDETKEDEDEGDDSGGGSSKKSSKGR